MAIFPNRAEIASAEVLMFEIASERGIVNEGVLSAAGVGSCIWLGGAHAAGVLAAAGTSAAAFGGQGAAYANVDAAGGSAATFGGAAAIQASLSASGAARAFIEGVTFMPGLQLGDDPMTRGLEQRSMARTAEDRAMATTVDDELDRPAENRGMTK